MNKLIIWIVLLVFLFPANTYALSCAQIPSMDQAYDRYDAVLIGLVEGVVRKKNSNQIQVTVVKSFKGIEEHTIKVDEDITWGSLNGPSEKGMHYLFFLKKNGIDWVNPLCSPSKKLADASKELDYLKDKEIPLKEAKATSGSFIGDNASKHWIVIAIFVGLTGAILVRILRYKKRSNRNK
ncbi:hypothetical protein HQN89_21055 [Paenibacillus frigoriresistens]|uniref:hypothetical protein n=1 Tax=Paenibacillus alginolyticus TaxID=59839 RepID=UPI0015654C0B|nr:hypothetical protein [Paenibacillus frigoriresistens]NRF93439.1 hypothetical protein [Paenibacillus frigoriresistens]